jgi:hypothetical protein
VPALPLVHSTLTSLNNIVDATNYCILLPPPSTAVSSKSQEFQDNTHNSPTTISLELMSYLTSEEVEILTACPKTVINEAQNDTVGAESHIKNTSLKSQDKTSSKHQTPLGSVASDIQSRCKVMPSPVGATSQQGMSITSFDEPLLMRLDTEHGDTAQRGKRADQLSTIDNCKEPRQRDSGYFSSDGRRTSSASTLVDVTLDHA